MSYIAADVWPYLDPRIPTTASTSGLLLTTHALHAPGAKGEVMVGVL